MQRCSERLTTETENHPASDIAPRCNSEIAHNSGHLSSNTVQDCNSQLSSDIVQNCNTCNEMADSSSLPPSQIPQSCSIEMADSSGYLTSDIKTESFSLVERSLEEQCVEESAQKTGGMTQPSKAKSSRSKTHAKVSDEDKRRLVEAFDDEEDYLLLADELNIKRSTARSIVIRAKKRGGVVSLPRGGKRESITKVDDELRGGIEDILQANPTGTLVSISEELALRFPHKRMVSRSTIARVCDGLLFSIKDRITPSDINREDVKVARRNFSQWYSEVGQNLAMLIFIDQKAFNVWTNRSRGTSRIGERAIRVVGGQRGKNLSLTLAMSPQFGLLHAAFHDGDTTKESFQHFLNTLIECIPKCFSSTALVIKDAPNHRDCESPIPVKYLPPNSPMINPMEAAFSAWEMAVRAAFLNPEVQRRVHDRPGAANAGQTLVSWRRDILRELGQAALSEISIDNCLTWQQHCQAQLVKCEQLEDMKF